MELDEAVTAASTNVSLSDAPATATMVNAKNIEAKSASRLCDALDQVHRLYLRDGALGQSQGAGGSRLDRLL